MDICYWADYRVASLSIDWPGTTDGELWAKSGHSQTTAAVSRNFDGLDHSATRKFLHGLIYGETSASALHMSAFAGKGTRPWADVCFCGRYWG
jgi:hypothetical protein